jgi:hypothetical protein
MMDALLSLVERLFFADFTATQASCMQSRTKSQVEAAGDRQTNDARGKSREFEEFWAGCNGEAGSTHLTHSRITSQGESEGGGVAWAVTGGRQHGVLG